MKLTVLADNRTQNAALETEHGLSVHLDTGKMKVLLDTGASDAFLRNAEVLRIDLSDVDYVFISHAHRDHAGGLACLLEMNTKAKVIVSSEALKGAYCSLRNGLHDITTDWPWEHMRGRLISVDNGMEIGGMKIISAIGRTNPIPKADRYLYQSKSEGVILHDDFKHEIALQVEDFLFTGCAHNGLMNTLESAERPLLMVLGGFHLPDASGNEEFENDTEIRSIASHLQERYPDTVFYTGHCTGDKAFIIMKQTLGDNLMQFGCGMEIVR